MAKFEPRQNADDHEKQANNDFKHRFSDTANARSFSTK